MNNISYIFINLRIKDRKMKRNSRFSWWLRDVAKSTYFCCIHHYGEARSGTASSDIYVSISAMKHYKERGFKTLFLYKQGDTQKMKYNIRLNNNVFGLSFCLV